MSFTESEIEAIADNLQSAGFYLQDWNHVAVNAIFLAELHAADSEATGDKR